MATTAAEEDLFGREFLTQSPPDLPPRHRILALLGTSDVEGAASPDQDGWFVSDFYLFHHLLSPDLPRGEEPAPNQIWLTCESPETLVTKYHEYLHEDSTGVRRVVLDSQRLPAILDAGNIQVVSRETLREQYLNILQEQAAEAARLDEHLVLLTFGHVTRDYDVDVAGSNLCLDDLRLVLPEKSQVTLFTGSCYSSGWVVISDLAQQDPKGIFPNGIVGLFSAALAATAITRCLIDMEDDELKEAKEDPAYKQLANSVYNSIKGIGMQGDTQQIHFSAEDDDWEASYRPRLGLSLLAYQQKWEALRHAESSAILPDYLAREYFAARPGPDNSAHNISLHGALYRALEGTSHPYEDIQGLTEATAYRLAAMYEADYLREKIGIKYPSIFNIDTSLPFADVPDKRLRARVFWLLVGYGINATPMGIKRDYDKPLQYLVLALVDTSPSWEAIEKQVKAMAGKRKAWFRFIYRAWHGNQIARDEVVRRHLCAFFEALKKIRR